MKTLNFSSTSWHYRIATFGDKHRCYEVEDICSYTRKFMGGFFLLILATVSCGLVSYAISDFFTWLIACITNQTLIIPEIPAQFVICSIATTAGFLAIVCTALTARDYLSIIKKNKKDSFIGNAYRSFKDKYCMKVNIN